MLGGGFIAGAHFECIQRVFGLEVEVVGIYDVIQEKCTSFAQERGIKAFGSLEAVLKEVDVVDICTPPFAHAQNIIDAAKAGKHIMCEKPLIGYSPAEENAESFRGNLAPKAPMLQTVLGRLKEVDEVVTKNNVKFTYFENFVYTPQIQKEVEIIRKSKSQILRMIGEESHKGNHAAYSSWWKYACGGSLISTGSHPLGAILYLKQVEGEASNGTPIRPAAVSARVHELTKIRDYRDAGFLRCNYEDVEDYAWAHVVFEDGTVGDVVTGATVLGGINDYVDVFANNHRTRCNINPVSLVETYNPKASQLNGMYINYGIITNEGWLYPAPDENWMFGYQAEMQDALECVAFDRQPIASLQLAIDTLNVIYSAYLSAERLGQEISVERK
jgi:predicted dehydrogenase